MSVGTRPRRLEQGASGAARDEETRPASSAARHDKLTDAAKACWYWRGWGKVRASLAVSATKKGKSEKRQRAAAKKRPEHAAGGDERTTLMPSPSRAASDAPARDAASGRDACRRPLALGSRRSRRQETPARGASRFEFRYRERDSLPPNPFFGFSRAAGRQPLFRAHQRTVDADLDRLLGRADHDGLARGAHRHHRAARLHREHRCSLCFLVSGVGFGLRMRRGWMRRVRMRVCVCFCLWGFVCLCGSCGAVRALCRGGSQHASQQPVKTRCHSAGAVGAASRVFSSPQRSASNFSSVYKRRGARGGRPSASAPAARREKLQT